MQVNICQKRKYSLLILIVLLVMRSASVLPSVTSPLAAYARPITRPRQVAVSPYRIDLVKGLKSDRTFASPVVVSAVCPADMPYSSPGGGQCSNCRRGSADCDIDGSAIRCPAFPKPCKDFSGGNRRGAIARAGRRRTG